MSSTREMLNLRFAVVGQRAIATLEVPRDLAVCHLREMLREQKQLEGGSIFYQLYLAVPRGASQAPWLKTTDDDYEALVRGDALARAAYFSDEMEMLAYKQLSAYFPTQPDEHAQTIHVLVRLPTEEEMQEMFVRMGLVEPKKAKTKEPEGNETGLGALAGLLADSWDSVMAWIAPEKPPAESSATTAENKKMKAV